jgi:hypothetical protein
MQHSANAADGKYGSDKINSEHDWPDRWKNHEEYSTTHADNGYRRETGLPERTNYADMP